MENTYLLSESDLKDVTLLAASSSSSFFCRAYKKSDGKIPFLLTPLADESLYVVTTSLDRDNVAIKEKNEKRARYLLKKEKAKADQDKAHIFALLATLWILLAIGSAFFAVGFGLKVHGAFYALLLVSASFLYLTYRSISKGATLYSSFREKKRVAEMLLRDSTPKEANDN